MGAYVNLALLVVQLLGWLTKKMDADGQEKIRQALEENDDLKAINKAAAARRAVATDDVSLRTPDADSRT